MSKTQPTLSGFREPPFYHQIAVINGRPTDSGAATDKPRNQDHQWSMLEVLGLADQPYQF